MPEKNELHLEKLSLHLEEYSDEIQEIVYHMGRRCLKPQGDNNCEKAFWYHKCWKTYDPKVNTEWMVHHADLEFLTIFILFFAALLLGLDHYTLYRSCDGLLCIKMNAKYKRNINMYKNDQ